MLLCDLGFDESLCFVVYRVYLGLLTLGCLLTRLIVGWFICYLSVVCCIVCGLDLVWVFVWVVGYLWVGAFFLVADDFVFGFSELLLWWFLGLVVDLI